MYLRMSAFPTSQLATMLKSANEHIVIEKTDFNWWLLIVDCTKVIVVMPYFGVHEMHSRMHPN